MRGWTAVAFTGGSGSLYGAALGALLLTSVNSVLPSIGVSSVWVQAIDGTLLLLAIAVDRVVALRSPRCAPGQTCTAGDMGTFMIGQDSSVVLGKPTVFDKSNIGRFTF